ncbi:MAG: aldo/keto reductase [Betaproteobacteria bacterium]|nr:MAG: aldo/keto reductase [Betaproteobacteria bacterium]
MDYRNLGNSGLKVSPICLGTMMFGARTDAAEAGRIVASARAAGINFIDTADAYAKGESERITGKLIASDREQWVLATKVGNAMGKGPNDSGLSRSWMMRAIDASLARLNTDWVDIYYLHLDDPATPIEETLVAMGDIIAAGKTRYFGISNYRGWRIAQIVELCDKLGVPAPIVCQPYYNAMNRMPETEVLPACASYGLGVVPYSPLARGVLTGKYAPGQAPAADTRAGHKDKRMMETEFREESLAMAQAFKAHAEKRGMSAGQFALNWVLNNRIITSALAGPRTLEQWSEYLGALAHPFSAEDEALVDSMVKSGHPSTPGYNDPRYVIAGRPTYC